MSNKKSPPKCSPFQILVHLFMTPRTAGTFSWELTSHQMTRLAEDLRWNVLRRIFPALEGSTVYKAFLQRHAIRVDSLDVTFFKDILELVREKHLRSFRINDARQMSDLECLKTYFLPLILEWAKTEHSTSIAQERTSSIEELIVHESPSGNVYIRFPDELSWAVTRFAPDIEDDPPRELPPEIRSLVQKTADALINALSNILEKGKLEKYVILLARLEDDVCTWEMTFEYLTKAGMNRYSSWKSLSVAANRAIKELVRSLPKEIRELLHQDDSTLTPEEKHERLRLAVSAALEMGSLPSPQEVLATLSG